MKHRYRFASGGTGAGKTIAILQVLLDLVATLKNKRIDIVAESTPALRGGAWQDCLNILAAQNLTPYVDIVSNPEMQITFPQTKSSLHFIAFDKVSKAHGSRRWGLYLNEANHIPWPIANQLMVRTAGPIYADWNPSAEFWAYDEIIYNPSYAGAWDFVTVTYKDNEALPVEVVADIERRKGNLAWWRTYGLGLLGTTEGRVFDWRVIPSVPYEARFIRRGMDFGFTNDPTGILGLYSYNGGYILDEECYQKGMMNPTIADYIGALPHPSVSIIADSSEPKSIAEIRVAGKPYEVSILGAQKWPNSKRDSANFVKTLPISITARSTNLRKEVEQYLWVEDRISGKPTNELPDGNDHLIDAAFYALNPLVVSNRQKSKAKSKSSWTFAQAYGGQK